MVLPGGIFIIASAELAVLCVLAWDLVPEPQYLGDMSHTKWVKSKNYLPISRGF